MDVTVDGTCAGEFEPLRDLLARNLADGTDAGAAVAIVRDGELVADIWGGEARPGVPWERDTLVQVWSISKTMAALTVLTLASRGQIDLDAPAAEYWSAFGVEGKGEIPVRHLLGHTSGLPGWSVPVSVDDLIDLEHTEALLAADAPWYEPGSAPAYQLINHGHLLDGVVRGATGRPLAEIFHEEIAGPLTAGPGGESGGDFFLGVPSERLGDVADLIAPTSSSIDFAALPPDAFILRTVANPLLTADVCNSEAWRRDNAVAGAGGHANARGVARIQAAISHHGEVGGVRLVDEATVARIFEIQSEGVDLVLGVPIAYGMGYSVPTPSAPAIPQGRVCWWTGYGGSIVVNDLDRRTTVAFTPNKLHDHMVSSPRTDEYVRTAFACLENTR
ncbi:serine hydrolase [Nocardioides sp. R-C-SC26]|uniref:serine hydrolase domain-containing protein n=1 Tax=Nocardioides sp. R-C-SC26 TaxID=2870414 RepID=UPI001E323666|nr:serine hydrolase domain-containing protein [Nocardioides sp. R-C-SC26]